MKTCFVLNVVVLSVLTLIVTACGTPLAPATLPPLPPAPSPTTVSGPSATSIPTLAPSPQPTATTASKTNDVTSIGEDQNGQTLTVRQGAHIQLVLHSTYWQMKGSSDVQVLAQVGEPSIVPDLTVNIPGTGAGTITVEFQALQPGRADISASRTTCGEALACTPDKRSFEVTVIVTP